MTTEPNEKIELLKQTFTNAYSQGQIDGIKLACNMMSRMVLDFEQQIIKMAENKENDNRI